MIALSCGIKISAVHHLVFVTIHASVTDRQNCDSNTVHFITCSHMVKTNKWFGTSSVSVYLCVHVCVLASVLP